MRVSQDQLETAFHYFAGGADDGLYCRGSRKDSTSLRMA